MNRLVYAVAAGLVSLPVCAVVADGPQKTPAADVQESKAAERPAAAPVDKSAPAIVVHLGAQPKDDRDGRVQVGGTVISMAPWITEAPKTDAASNAPAIPKRADGAIEAPSNTLGPGEPLWVISDRRDAERKLAAAEAEHARTIAERASVNADRCDTGYTGYGSFFGGAYLGGHGFRHNGLRGPVSTTITRSDSLGSTAQRAYFDAAYPRLNGTQDAHDRAVSRFGKDATPPIVRIQNDIDRAHTNANKEHPKR